MKRKRDSQRSRVYRAERTVPPDKFFNDIEEVREYVDKIVSSRWWKNRYPWVKKVFVEHRTRGCNALGYAPSLFCTAGRISLPRWAWNNITVLHELAHTVVIPRPTIASHGPEYCKTLLALVDRWGPSEGGKQLRAAFKQHRVKYIVRKNGRAK